ncbi:hypothetical protein [Nocardioides abyssi]|uniref:Uncharacterized protein n=1 Tax=Nocardioides abyssi TaxID=3058370 RepID=A0ABT8EZ85_9ACTN|nr:hypothetical protein [Nocardioides abyssi]MDN4163329.1 hypothetical protein [Nocardioides abyssi]
MPLTVSTLAALALSGLAVLPVVPGTTAPAAAATLAGTSETQLSTAGPAVGTTAVATDPGNARHLVAWSEAATAGGKSTIRGQFVSTAGAKVGGNGALASVGGAADASQDVVDPALAWDPANNRFLLAYAADTVADAAGAADTTAFEVFVRQVSVVGALGDPVQVSHACADDTDTGCDARNPDLAVAPDGTVTVVWEGNDDTTPDLRTRTDVWARTLGPGLLPSAPEPVRLSATVAGDTSLDPAVAVGPGRSPVAVWSTLIGPTLRAYAATVPTAGAATAQLLNGPGPDAAYPDIAADDAGWLVVWDTGAGQVAGTRLAAGPVTQTWVGTLGLGRTASRPRLAHGGGNRWTLGWVAGDAGSVRQVVASELRQSGTAAPRHRPSSTPSTSALSAAAPPPCRPARPCRPGARTSRGRATRPTWPRGRRPSTAARSPLRSTCAPP